MILCEDTRQTQTLLNFYTIKKPTLSYHQHSKFKKIDYILNLLKHGKDLALVCDAGTPGISDPGNKLIEIILTRFNLVNIRFVPVPGPSALIAAASISGFPMDKFLFLGFPPHKKKRKKFFEEVINSKYPVIFYESTHRILKTLRELKSLDEKLKIVVYRELTKAFETIYRGRVGEVLEQLEKGEKRGEFVIIVEADKRG